MMSWMTFIRQRIHGGVVSGHMTTNSQLRRKVNLDGSLPVSIMMVVKGQQETIGDDDLLYIMNAVVSR